MKSLGYSEALLSGANAVGIWGVGYVGYSTMVHLAAKGVRCVGYDVNSERVKQINQGDHPVRGLDGWLPIDTKPLIHKQLLRATSDRQEILRKEVLVHVIAVPTSQSGCPSWGPLRSVITELSDAISRTREKDNVAPLIVIESTIAPGTTDSILIPIFGTHRLVLGRDVLLGIAPRRDWFVDREKSLQKLDRIFCGTDEASADATQDFLSILCSTLHRASNYRIGELVKCVENSFRHAEIALSNQLCLAFPDIDIREVLELASTKWNMGYFFPSFGAGGGCVPLASQYLLQGAQNANALSLLTISSESELNMRLQVAAAVLARGCRRIAILGLSYRGDIKVSELSPTILIAKHLREAGATVKIYDPYYTRKEIFLEAGADSFEFPKGLNKFDAILITAGHREFSEPEVKQSVLSMRSELLIIDNCGIWDDWDWPSTVRYYRPGWPNWLYRRK